MPDDRYLRYEPSVEQPRPDEAQTIAAIVGSIQRTNKSSFDRHHRGIRQQHAKGQGYLRGELKIHDNLPAHLRQGMFASPGTHPIIVRLSTAFGDIRSDRIRVPRGMAIKVLGVSGRKALPGDTSTNQDFLLVNHKSYFADAAAYLSAQRSFEWEPRTPDFGLRFLGFVGRGFVNFSSRTGVRIPMVLKALGEAGNNILGETFYSEAARLSAAPISEPLIRLSGQPCHDDDGAVLKSVVAYFNKNSAEYELRAQLCTDLKRTPIEDASIDWPEDISPQLPLARITLPPQAADSPARRFYSDDVLSFDPWRCLAEHRPLGSIMRLRKEAYAASSAFRNEKNKNEKKEPVMKEPRDISEFPD